MNIRDFQKPQAGSVLIASLIMLLLLTLLAMSAMTSSTFQEKMTLNSHEYATGLGAAESGLRDGEAWIGSSTITVRPIPGDTGVAGANCGDSTPPSPVCDVWLPSVATTASAARAWDLSKTGADRYRTASWWTSYAIPFGSTILGANGGTGPTDGRSVPLVQAQPASIIEQADAAAAGNSLVLDPTNTYRYFYQVTSRGVARTQQASLIVQSVYARIY